MAAALLALASTATAGTLRIATFDTELGRKGPGLLLADLLKAEDPQVQAVIEATAAVGPDVLVLQGVDRDADALALGALADLLAAAGQRYPHRLMLRSNKGRASGLDLDGDGRLDEPEDRIGYGAFTGQSAVAVLSRLPIIAGESRDFSRLAWGEFPGALLPPPEMMPWLDPQALARLPLASSSMADLALALPDGGRLHLLVFDAQSPVFDGPEDLNGRRNHDQLAFWRLLLDGALAGPPWHLAPPPGPVVLAGDANLDPVDGEGRHDAIRALLTHPALTDPRPASTGGAAAANPAQKGDPALDTVDWPDPDPGNLRVDYVLPSSDLVIADAGVLWPAPGAPLADTVSRASRHRLVWVDISVP